MQLSLVHVTLQVDLLVSLCLEDAASMTPADSTPHLPDISLCVGGPFILQVESSLRASYSRCRAVWDSTQTGCPVVVCAFAMIIAVHKSRSAWFCPSMIRKEPTPADLAEFFWKWTRYS